MDDDPLRLERPAGPARSPEALRGPTDAELALLAARSGVLPKQVMPDVPLHERIRRKRATYAIGAAFFVLLWLAVLPVGLLMSSMLGQGALRSTTFLFALVILGWGLLGGSRKALLAEHGVFEVLLGRLRHEAKPLELDEAPAKVLRRRGQPMEALAMYEGWIGEFPNRLDLRMRRAELLLHDLRDRDSARTALVALREEIAGFGPAATPEQQGLDRLAAEMLRSLDTKGAPIRTVSLRD